MTFNINKLRVVNMKYIKLYEGFEVYHDVSYTTYMEYRNMPFDIITKIEYDNIMSCLSGLSDFEPKEVRRGLAGFPEGTDLNQGCVTIVLGIARISINKVQDEWFYAFIESSKYPYGKYYYKCDQIDAVLQLIRDKAWYLS